MRQQDPTDAICGRDRHDRFTRYKNSSSVASNARFITSEDKPPCSDAKPARFQEKSNNHQIVSSRRDFDRLDEGRTERSTIEMGKKAVADESRRLGAAVAIIDADVGGGRGGEHLALVLEGDVGLGDSDGELTGGMGFEFHVPQQPIAAAEPPEASLQRPQARAQHPRYLEIRVLSAPPHLLVAGTPSGSPKLGSFSAAARAGS
ncbi:hypothetical protein B296_00027831 [Ensete ventricosum]|uniref:Uncharacterized protein n=1 Tax=Ensete ventricosum TaxID=4639 RepID=A0A426ZLZ4_ENSVE|nr:hypothetical protein B296_00027831 [Ensete ventricosum]